MADYDNGLPPDTVDISEKKIDSVLIDRRNAEEGANSCVNSILVETKDVVNVSKQSINSILVEKENAWHNFATFL